MIHNDHYFSIEKKYELDEALLGIQGKHNDA